MSIKSVNDTMSANALVPSLLVYGVLQTFPGQSKSKLKQSERFEEMKLERAEMEIIVAE